MKSKKMGFVIDPLHTLDLVKDSTLAMMREAQHQGFEIVTFELGDLMAEGGEAAGNGTWIEILWGQNPIYTIVKQEKISLSDLDYILMRKDPPVDQEYLYATFILELAQTKVTNPPWALRNINEKIILQHFPDLSARSLMTRNLQTLKSFLAQHHKIVVKPLGQMGGQGVFIVDQKDPNQNVILETLTHKETQTIIAQPYLDQISQGDQRILIFHGEPVDLKVVRIPGASDHRGNLAAGASSKIVPITDQQRAICQRLKPWIEKQQLSIVGLDMIGDTLTEINITSPTCLRELEEAGLEAAKIYLQGFA